MKNLRVFQVFLLITLTSVLVACGGGKQSPAEIEMSIWKKIKSGDYEKAVKLWYENSELDPETTPDELDQITQAFTKKIQEEVDRKGGIQDVKIVSEDISEDGQSAVVKVSVTYKNGDVQDPSSKYILVDGKWKMDNSK